ncbi:alcohol dehydrogenase, partial [Ceratobasidium sp. UAMH 11750]
VSLLLSAKALPRLSRSAKLLVSNGLPLAACRVKPVREGEIYVHVLWTSISAEIFGACRNESVCPDAQCSGYTVDGSFQQYAVSYAAHVTPIPQTIPLDLAAPILCAGVTVFKAIKQAGTQPGDIIVISGAGGGLGHLAIQYAINGFGLRVIALDTGDEKKALCEKLGAEAFVDFKTSGNLIEEIKKVADGLGPHAAIVASASSVGYDQALQYLRPGGTLVAVGLPPGAKIDADVFWTVVRSITVKGSYVGNREDARQALDIAARGRVRTTYRVEPLGKLPDVFKEMKEGKLAGRVVLDLWK